MRKVNDQLTPDDDSLIAATRSHIPGDTVTLTMAIPPTTHAPSNLWLIGMDPAGFPNGRRVFDDVTTIELRAIAGVTYALVDSSFTPDKAAGAITQGLTSSNTDVTAENTEHYLPVFPYLGSPHSGYGNPATNTPAPYPPGPPRVAGGAHRRRRHRGRGHQRGPGHRAARRRRRGRCRGRGRAAAAHSHRRPGEQTESDSPTPA